MFALKSVVRTAYAYAGSQPDNPLAARWCRDSIRPALAGLIELTETLHNRFTALFEQLGNDADNITKTRRFLDHLRELDTVLENADTLPVPESWCPPALYQKNAEG